MEVRKVGELKDRFKLKVETEENHIRQAGGVM